MFYCCFSFLAISETPTVPQLTQAQVILNGLNSLFEAVERQTLDMLDRVEEIVIPDEWRNVDLVKQTKEVMVQQVTLYKYYFIYLVHYCWSVFERGPSLCS